MSILLDELKTAMAAEKGACEKLLELGESKKEQLIKNRVNELNLTVRAEAETVKRLKAAAKRRQEALNALALEHETPEMDFESILALLPESERAEMETFKASFQGTVNALGALNALNQRLIETQIQYTDFCLNAFTGGAQGLDTYENTGHVRAETPPLTSLIDRKA